MSMPAQRRSRFCAATTAVPQPQKGSRTRVAGVGGEREDAFEQAEGLLGRVTAACQVTRAERWNVDPDIPERRAALFVQIALEAGDRARPGLNDAPVVVSLLHALTGPAPDAGDAQKLVGEVGAFLVGIDQVVE